MSNIALSTNQIDDLLKTDSNFKGTFPCDQIPHSAENEHSYVINTDPMGLPGSHWCALVIRGNNAYFFDSFGRFYNNQSFPVIFRENLRKICFDKKVVFQNKVLQGFHSNTCGEYCVYFIKQMSKHVNFNTIFRDFTQNLKANDKKIMSLYKEN